MALIQNFSFFKGDTAPVNVTLTGTNLTSVTVKWSLKTNMDSTTNLIYKDTASGITITDAALGKFTFTLSEAQTATLSGAYYHEAKITDALGNVTTVMTGEATSNIGAVTHSYVTVTDADLYFDVNVLFPEPWTTTVAATKEKALVAATRKIDSQVLRGIKAVETQTLQFPRTLYSYDVQTPRNITGANWNVNGWIAETTVHQDVRDAVCEEALAMLRQGISAQKRVELQRQGVTSFSLGSLSESYSGSSVGGNKLLSVTAAQLLARYIGGGRYIS